MSNVIFIIYDKYENLKYWIDEISNSEETCEGVKRSRIIKNNDDDVVLEIDSDQFIAVENEQKWFDNMVNDNLQYSILQNKSLTTNNFHN
jgi:hypothetical protein